MFDALSQRLSQSFEALRRRGTLREADVEAALREVRVALLEADVALPVVRDFTAKLQQSLVGEAVLASVSPSQMVIKHVHDALVELLGGDASQPPSLTEGEATSELNLAVAPPAVVLMCGLQGSGKTTTTGKLALRLRSRARKRVLVASLDIYRPAAQEQLALVAAQAQVEALPVIVGEAPLAITARALREARLGGYDVLLLDTAGRLSIDDALMAELQAIKQAAAPVETLLVADALTGQDALTTAQAFHAAVGLTGLILTRMDGDARGGAALSMRAVTGQPIRYLGVGEKLSELERFDPVRVAGRILDRGDVVALVEKAAEAMAEGQAEQAAKRMMAGKFDLNDMLTQMRQIQTMGGLGGLMNLLPGMGKLKEMAGDRMPDARAVRRQEALILSMTPDERANPALLNASRRRRIALGAGQQVSDVNRLIKQYQQMETMMKQVKKLGLKGAMNPAAMARMLGGLRG